MYNCGHILYLVSILVFVDLTASSLSGKAILNSPISVPTMVRSVIHDAVKVSTIALSSLSASSSTNARITIPPTTSDSLKHSTSAKYTTIGKDDNQLPMCRVLTGMWQVSGLHGYEPNKEQAVAEMARYVNEGFSTFDLADIYGPAEDFVGEFRKGIHASVDADKCQFFTKYVR